jgi:hypothetical protein
VTSHERAAAAPRNIRDNLAPGGRLIVGVEPPRLRAGRAPLRYWWHGTDKLLTLTGHTEVDAVAQRTTSWNRRAGELIKTELEPFTLQWYGLSEFSAMLHEAGFHHVTIHADYQTGQHPGTGKQDVDIRSHTRLRASAETDLLFFDTTSTYFVTQDADPPVPRGEHGNAVPGGGMGS